MDNGVYIADVNEQEEEENKIGFVYNNYQVNADCEDELVANDKEDKDGAEMKN